MASSSLSFRIACAGSRIVSLPPLCTRSLLPALSLPLPPPSAHHPKPSYELQTKGPVVYCTVQDETKTEELYLALKDNTLLLMAAMKQYADPINRINLLGGVLKLMNAHGQVGFQIDEVRDGSVVEQHIIWMQQESQRSQWHGSLERATVDGAIPSGITFTGTPSEYELCERLPEISETEVHLQKVSQRLLLRRQRCAWREARGSGDPALHPTFHARLRRLVLRWPPPAVSCAPRDLFVVAALAVPTHPLSSSSSSSPSHTHTNTRVSCRKTCC